MEGSVVICVLGLTVVRTGCVDVIFVSGMRQTDLVFGWAFG